MAKKLTLLLISTLTTLAGATIAPSPPLDCQTEIVSVMNLTRDAALGDQIRRGNLHSSELRNRLTFYPIIRDTASHFQKIKMLHHSASVQKII